MSDKALLARCLATIKSGTHSLKQAASVEFLCDDLRAAIAQQEPAWNCEYCDGTGDVHSMDGEWRGICSCVAGDAIRAAPVAPAPEPSDDTHPNFASYMRRNYPNGTVIGDIEWHIPRIWKAAKHASKCGVVEPVSDEQNGPAYGIIDPDYARVFTMARCLAWGEGYALMMHGSFTRDLDLLAVPWADQKVCEPDHLINRIVDAADLKKLHSTSKKPHGRVAFTLAFKGFADPRFIDISILTQAAPVALSDEPMLKALRVAVLALAHAAEKDDSYKSAYTEVSDAIEAALRGGK